MSWVTVLHLMIYYVHVHMELMKTYVFGYCSSFDGLLFICRSPLHMSWVIVLHMMENHVSSFDGLLFTCLGLLFFIMFIYYVHVHMGLMRTYVFGYCCYIMFMFIWG